MANRLSDPPADAAGSPVRYAYRPSPMGSVREFKLTDSGVDWVAGATSGHLLFSNIRRLRMSYRPVALQSHRFVTELWGEGALKLQIVSSSWKSMFEQERLDQPYLAFIYELHQRLSGASSPARLQKGSSPFLYWPGLIIFVGVVLGIVGLIVRALQIGAVGGAAFIGVFLVLLLWQSGNFFWRNRPGVYFPDVLPTDVMPRR